MDFRPNQDSPEKITTAPDQKIPNPEQAHWSADLKAPSTMMRTEWGSYQEIPQKNGLTAHLAHIPKGLDVGVVLTVPAGPYLEANYEQGMSHFIEHMQFRGTKRFPSEEKIDQEAKRHRIFINAYTERHHTVYSMRGPNSAVVAMLELMDNLMREPVFLPSHIELEKRIVTSEIVEFKFDFNRRIHEEYLLPALYPNAGLRPTALGTIDSVRNFDRKSLLAFRKKHYSPDTMQLFVMGGLPASIEEDISRTLGNIPKREIAPDAIAKAPINFMAPHPAEQLLVRNFPADGIMAVVSFPGIPDDSPDRDSAKALVQHLNDRTNGPLYKRLRRDSGLVYNYAVSQLSQADLASFQIRFIVPSEAELTKALVAIRNSVKLLGMSGLSSKEFDTIKNDLTGTLPTYELDIRQSLPYLYRRTGRVIVTDELRRDLAAMTNEKIIETARKIFSTPMHVAAFGNVQKDKIVIP